MDRILWRGSLRKCIFSTLQRLLINSVKFKTSGLRSGREEWVYIWLLASGSNSWLQSQLAWEWTAVFPRDINFMTGKGGGNSGVLAPPNRQLVLPWILGCLYFLTLRLGPKMTWANAQTYAPSFVLLRGLVEPREGPWSVFHVRLLKTAFFFQICTGISRSFHNQMWFVKQGPCLL